MKMANRHLEMHLIRNVVGRCGGLRITEVWLTAIIVQKIGLCASIPE